MKPIEDFVRQHFLSLFLLLFAVQLIRRIFRHWKHGVRFPRLNSLNVLFHESRASGNSDRNFFTRLGGARRCLRVTVTDQEILVRSPFPFSLIVESDLEHRIARGSITAVQRVKGKFSEWVQVDFLLPCGKTRRLSLRLKNPEAFLAALGIPGARS